MTANAVVGPVPQLPPRSDTEAAVETMVRLVRSSFAVVEPYADEMAKYFYEKLFSIAPETRDMFPVTMSVQRVRLLRSLMHIVQRFDRPDELVPFLRQLGRDHRKFGVITSHYESFGMALLAAIKHFAGDAWTAEVEHAWAEAFTIVARSMLDAAAMDDGPAYWQATVIDHQRLSRDLAILRVKADYPVPYRPGQYVSVETPQRPRLWRYLSPANAPTEDGVMEFHVRAVAGGWVSPALVAHARTGDRWRIGPAFGRLTVDREAGQDILMVAGGTGLAPMRAIVDHLSQWGENPRVHLFYGGRVRTDLYDLNGLRQLASTNPWLTVVPVLESEPEMAGVEHGTLADVVTRYGAWEDRRVLVSGSPSMIRSTVSRMLVAGTQLDRISYDPFTVD
ncbi:globin domain-containing protein [Labedaea rhizosphaerae]|uniref:nitric oxide dioxygenase n=1 Tax=Labedaea rhizosphaerae TaxID=598644 RepID=A0A4R6SP16_LABRH|nr:globin domain-containing protein [Labedaea rhizosphaerae]TDQ05320.1 NAD(P)H-flavin reductase [Labedaea rhizosphaerae]